MDCSNLQGRSLRFFASFVQVPELQVVVSVKFCKKGIGGMWLDEIKRFMGRVKGGRSHLPFLGEWFELGGAGLRRGVFVLIAE